MRMLLKAVMDTEAANQDSQAGTIVEHTARLLEALKPEAAYFVVEDGQRSCLSSSTWKTLPRSPPSVSRCSLVPGQRSRYRRV